MDGEVDDEDELFVVQRELHDVIAEVLNRHRLMPTKWIAVIEVLDAEGQRALESFCSPDFRAWDSIGMLGFIDARERGAISAEQQAEEGPDSA